MILEEVIGPDVIGALGSDRHGVPSSAAPPAATTRPGQAQAQLLPQAVDPLAVDGPALAPEHRPGPSIAVTGVPLGQVPQPLAEGLVPVRARAVSQAGPAEVQQSAGSPLGDPPPSQEGDRLPAVGQGHDFLASSSRRASTSKSRSARSRLSRAFSCSR